MASANWSADALQDLGKIDLVVRKRIVEKVIWLERNFDNIVPQGLRRDFSGLHKLRIGDYRAIYSVSGNAITIEMVRHRSDVYK
jgi:mRNA interferase RelE/StbE